MQATSGAPVDAGAAAAPPSAPARRSTAAATVTGHSDDEASTTSSTARPATVAGHRRRRRGGRARTPPRPTSSARAGRARGPARPGTRGPSLPTEARWSATEPVSSRQTRPAVRSTTTLRARRPRRAPLPEQPHAGVGHLGGSGRVPGEQRRDRLAPLRGVGEHQRASDVVRLVGRDPAPRPEGAARPHLPRLEQVHLAAQQPGHRRPPSPATASPSSAVRQPAPAHRAPAARLGRAGRRGTPAAAPSGSARRGRRRA